MLSLPIILLTLFAAGNLLIDAITPAGWNWINPVTALAGIFFASLGVLKIQHLQSGLEETGRRLEWAFGHSMLFDHLTVYFYYLILASCTLAVLLWLPQIGVLNVKQGKVCALILTSTLGTMLTASGFNIVVIFAGFALLSGTGYFLSRHSENFLLSDDRRKYVFRDFLALSILASGLCLLYAETRQTNLQLISQRLKGLFLDHSAPGNHVIAILAVALIAIGLLLKLGSTFLGSGSLSEQENGIFNGFILVTSQVAAGAALLRIFLWGLYSLRTAYVPVLIVGAAVLMLAGTFTSLTETNPARLLMGASVAHGGFMLLGLIAVASVTYPAPPFFEGFKGFLFYLVVYAIANTGALALVMLVEHSDRMQRSFRKGMASLAGCFYRVPYVAILLAVLLASLAGLPFVAGFYGKYFILHSLFASGHLLIAELAVICVLGAIYFYGRLAQVMFVRGFEPNSVTIGMPARIVLSLASLFLVFIGVYPKPLIDAVEWSIRLT